MSEIDLVSEVRALHPKFESDMGDQCGTCLDLWPCEVIRLVDAHVRLREALEFYADEKNYDGDGAPEGCGRVARTALAEEAS